MKPSIALAALALILVGCAPQVTAPTTYGDVVELRDAAVAAGLPCPAWEQKNQVTLASTSGTCSGQAVLSVFLSKDAVQELVTKAKSLPGKRTWLVGENWVINAPVADLDKIQPAMGGQRVEFS